MLFLKNVQRAFEEDVSICLVDKTDPSHPRKRVLLTEDSEKSSPFGINTEEKYLAVYTIMHLVSV